MHNDTIDFIEISSCCKNYHMINKFELCKDRPCAINKFFRNLNIFEIKWTFFKQYLIHIKI